MLIFLLTGASSGLGLALGRQLKTLHPASQIINISESTGPSDFVEILVDLSRKESLEHVVSALRSLKISRLDGLVLNAAVGSYGSFVDQSLAKIDEILALNLSSALGLFHTLWREGFLQKSWVVFVGSPACHHSSPDYNIYSVTKAALYGFVRSVRWEAGGEISIKLVEPPPMATGMHQKSGLPSKLMQGVRLRQPDEVASAILAKLPSSAWHHPIAWLPSFLVWADRLCPSLLDYFVLRRYRRAFRVASAAGEGPKS